MRWIHRSIGKEFVCGCHSRVSNRGGECSYLYIVWPAVSQCLFYSNVWTSSFFISAKNERLCINWISSYREFAKNSICCSTCWNLILFFILKNTKTTMTMIFVCPHLFYYNDGWMFQFMLPSYSLPEFFISNKNIQNNNDDINEH